MTSVAIVTALVRLAGLYLAFGAAFALWFAGRGAGRLDPVARAGTLGFRLLVVPGATLLWPWLLVRLARKGPRPPASRAAHRRAAATPAS